jgi:hypothetical protein
MEKNIWTKPEELQQLLTELDCQADSKVASKSRMTIIHDELGTLTLNGNEVATLLHSVETVNQMFDAIGQEADCTVEVSDFEVSPEVNERLEEIFDYVEVV